MTKFIGMMLFTELYNPELADYRDMLHFENEHRLSKEVLKMDVFQIFYSEKLLIKD